MRNETYSSSENDPGEPYTTIQYPETDGMIQLAQSYSDIGTTIEWEAHPYTRTDLSGPGEARRVFIGTEKAGYYLRGDELYDLSSLVSGGPVRAMRLSGGKPLPDVTIGEPAPFTDGDNVKEVVIAVEDIPAGNSTYGDFLDDAIEVDSDPFKAGDALIAALSSGRRGPAVQRKQELPANADGTEYTPWYMQPLDEQVSEDDTTMDEFTRILAERGASVIKYQFPNDFGHLRIRHTREELENIRPEDLTDEEIRALADPREPVEILEGNIQLILAQRSLRDGIRYGLQPGSFVPGALSFPETPGHEHPRSREGVTISPRPKGHGVERSGSTPYEPRLTEEWSQNLGERVRESAVAQGAGRTIRGIRQGLRRNPGRHRRKL